MLFAHDTDVALQSAAALVNTARLADDGLTTTDALTAFLDHWRFGGRRDQTVAELDEVRALRHQLAQFWQMTTDDAAAEANAILEAVDARPYLTRHDDWDWHIHVTHVDAPLAHRMGAEAAMAFVDLIRGGQLDRLATCAADDCDCVLVDLSRNRSRRFCAERNCGNRTNVAAYRRRLAGADRDATA
ncbi:CGNR zinc finger domain-containing protein [Williamsia sterculiae]|uniref:Putative stress-induced transcription regulator n=1 Tax=Williamsia sterculiae TaxID=1344003 RepID=A0A1N7H2I8_9NOCA|nr:CGNR zinc finger domain-containing protein [Williamsia sterculiae]SIS19049.1 Putative stress-induced transcription regulator [Williamsia sterculiae]